MILVVGIPSEQPVERVWRAGVATGTRVVTWNQRHFDRIVLDWQPGSSGTLHIAEARYPLDAFRGVFLRPIAAKQLPECQGADDGAERQRRHDALHALLFAWCEVGGARIANRVCAMRSNMSKPYQAARIRKFFDVPRTLVTSDPEAARTFVERYGAVIYKSISGTRSIVHRVVPDDLKRLHSIRWCPTQFQEYISGVDIRVHVVGHEVFAARIETSEVDYRYAARSADGWTRIQATSLDATIEDRCRALTSELGLVFSGIDLRLCPDGRLVCFEVNTSPGFTYYEEQTDHPIATAIARVLAAAPES